MYRLISQAAACNLFIKVDRSGQVASDLIKEWLSAVAPWLTCPIGRMGKKAVDLGGASQILFSIRGKRWDDNPFFQQTFN
jgi:hypothetical protein